jgi:hypothetical protein
MMEYELTIFCVTVIAILALAYGDRVVARHALNIMSGLVGSALQTLRQLQERMIR